MTDKIRKPEEEWAKELTPEQYHVMREKGTEAPYTGKYWKTKTPGVYRCASCGNPLFDSEDKFDSKTGWPSFTRPVAEDAVETESDYSLFMRRTEVLCARCEGHLGHVFDDGPRASTGLRFCINSASLALDSEGRDAGDTQSESESSPPGKQRTG